ncbi:DUF2637 domain-containing protein [Streptomyces sp. NPDC052496]|uniref:DUF2637 domain-containing protein n=1 Tax=Streptomyces sp. NPDC052496 TaxID=3154951 RepID=UPI00341DA7E6
MNDTPRVPVPPGTGRHRLPRQSTEEPVAFPGGIPYPHDGPLGQEMADDGWDAAVMQELGPELAELWDSAEQPPMAGGPGTVFYAAGEPVFPPGDGIFRPGDAGFRSDGAAFHDGGVSYHPDDAGHYPGEAPHRRRESVFLPGEAVFHSSGTVFPPDEPAFGPTGPAARIADVYGDAHGGVGEGVYEEDAYEDTYYEDTHEGAYAEAHGGAYADARAQAGTGAGSPAGAGPDGWSWRRLLSATSVLMTAVIAVAVAALGAVASYPSLRAIADGVAPADIAGLWPLLIYGPWVVATLSILRARAYRRRTLHSWAVVIFFAAVATLLCVAQVHPSPAGIAVAGLPPLTVLLCFHQFVRQLDLATAPPPAARHAQSNRGQHRHRSGG